MEWTFKRSGHVNDGEKVVISSAKSLEVSLRLELFGTE